MTRLARQLTEPPNPKNSPDSVRKSRVWNRERVLHQGLRRCTHPCRRLSRKSRWLERNRYRSPFNDLQFPFLPDTRSHTTVRPITEILEVVR